MRLLKIAIGIVTIVFCSCENPPKEESLHDLIDGQPSFSGKKEYLNSPYVTAGDRVYSVGHQDGSFPDLGWHVTGEMGGIWNHPIKLMDGFQLALGDEELACLTTAKDFINYPFGNRHLYETESGLSVSRFQFVPDQTEGLVVEYELTNSTAQPLAVKLAFKGYFDLMPVWLAEQKNIEDGQDILTREDETILVKDEKNEWSAVLSSSLPIVSMDSESPCDMENIGNGVESVLHQEMNIPANESRTVRYYISGSYESDQQAKATNDQLKKDYLILLQSKIDRLSGLNEFNQLNTSDQATDEMYEWLKYNNDWLMRDVPEVGKGISAGIPDYPWWFGTDAGYAIEGLLAQGQWDEALATIDIIIKLSEQANGDSGKIMHEASTNGIVFNPGNLNTTPRFIQTLWMAYSWTGDEQLLAKYYDLAKKGIAWIESQDKDGNGYADGPGMMEIHGLHTEMIDVVAYQEQAYRAAANLAKSSTDIKQMTAYLEKADLLKSKINTDWWSEEFNSYADFRATKEQAIELTEAAIVRADTLKKPWAVEELENTLSKIKSASNTGTAAYVVHHNWVVNTPLETGNADSEKALKALETAQEYQNRFGMFVTGIDRNEEQEEATKWKAFSYVGAVMTLPTGVQAIGAARYGNSNLSYDYVKRLSNSFSYALPGSMYEVSPDFGMVVQAWNSYAVAVPIVQYYFGITPLAHEKRIIWKPQLPDEWSEATLKEVRIGNNLITLSGVREEGELIWNISQTEGEWIVDLRLPNEKIILNGEEQALKSGALSFSGSNNKVVY